MSDNQEASVVHCVNETIQEHDPKAGIHDDWKMGDDYGYEDVSIKLFLNCVQVKLGKAGYDFTYKKGFGKSCLGKTLEDTKVAIDQNTEEA